MTHFSRLIALSATCISIMSGCTSGPEDAPSTHFDLEGHRGARGLEPENSIPAFIHALDLGVTTLELDVVLSVDGEVVVSHDPWFSSQICSYPDGTPVPSEAEKDLKLFAMTYSEISQFDCGSRGHPDFPEQRPVATAKPLLSDAILASEKQVSSTGRPPVLYNIEIKSAPDRDGVYYTSVSDYVQRLYDVITEQGILDRTLIQSFDPRALETMHEIDPSIPLILLVSNDFGFNANLDRLSFTPDVYSPAKRLVDQVLVTALHRLNIRVIPWTVDDVDEMKRLITLGVDGLITDYPDRGRALLEKLRSP